MISIVTPWHNTPELIDSYRRNKDGAQVVIVDNASDHEASAAIHRMVVELGGRYVYNPVNRCFAPANNQGFELTSGEIVVFLNSDTETPPGFIEQLERDVKPGALYGPSLQTNNIEGRQLHYIEGYCIAATRDTWRKVGLWNDEYTGLYWEDNDLAWRALHADVKLIRTDWEVIHYSNYTSGRTEGAYNHSAENQARFRATVREGSAVCD